MNRLLLVAALVGMLLLAGCIQTQQQEQKQTQQGAQQGTGAQQQTGGQTQQQTQQQTQEQEKNYNEMAMGALMNLGVPIKCTVTYNYAKEGMRGTYVYYILNKNTRMEGQSTTKEGTFSSTVIVKNEDVYVQATQEMKVGPYANCDWLFYSAEEKTAKEYKVNEDENIGAAYENLGYEYTYHCEPAMFGEEKFATPGKVCNMKEMMGNVCASITDPDARAQCEQAIAAQ